MPYTPQTWADNDVSKPVSAARMTVIENGIAVAAFNEAYYLNGSQANVRETLDRRLCNSITLAIGTTSTMTSYPIVLVAGDVITNLSFGIGSTAGGTMTHWWFALYDTQATPALIAQTADQTSGAIAQNTTITKALSAPYTVVTTGVYYTAISVTASQIPTLDGINTQTNISTPITGQKALGRTSGSSLNATAPATITSTSPITGTGYCVTS